jgi:hypothetical protein
MSQKNNSGQAGRSNKAGKAAPVVLLKPILAEEVGKKCLVLDLDGIIRAFILGRDARA